MKTCLDDSYMLKKTFSSRKFLNFVRVWPGHSRIDFHCPFHTICYLIRDSSLKSKFKSSKLVSSLVYEFVYKEWKSSSSLNFWPVYKTLIFHTLFLQGLLYIFTGFRFSQFVFCSYIQSIWDLIIDIIQNLILMYFDLLNGTLNSFCSFANNYVGAGRGHVLLQQMTQFLNYSCYSWGSLIVQTALLPIITE